MYTIVYHYTMKFDTKNNTINKEEIVKLLNHSLADLTTFKLQLKHAHWNVRGARFYQVHLLFDEIAEEVEEFVDKIAERITSLGGIANGLIHQAEQTNCVPAYPEYIVKDVDHLKALINSLGKISNEIRNLVIKTDEELGDPITADLYTEVSRLLDKRLWFLEAHIIY